MAVKIFESLFSKNDILKPVYFNMEVLERYFKNPQYIISYSDYRGSIYLRDEYCSNDLDEYEYIKDFGIAYNKKDKNLRALVTFADDLVKLPIKVQGIWYTYMLDNQKDYIPNEGFVKNLIYGEWVQNISIYQALLMEMHYINEMCKGMELKPMFKEEYPFNSSDIDDRPMHYHNILLPTRDSYYNFVNTLEKLVINNINHKTFINDSLLIKGIVRNNEYGQPKGTLLMLEEWFGKNVRGADIKNNVINPLRDLRKLRQRPAHELYQNEYDQRIWKDQEDLMFSVYTAIRNIRLLMANHPLAKSIKVPDVLFSGKNIVSY